VSVKHEHKVGVALSESVMQNSVKRPLAEKSRHQSQLPCPPLRVGPHLVNPASTVRDLGIYIDADLSERTCHHRYIVSQTWTLDVGLGHWLTQISF